MTCPTCHGELFADRRSVADLASRGYHGGRIVCAQGCTAIWIMRRAEGEAPSLTREPGSHTSHCAVNPRRVRTFLCGRCKQPTETTCSSPKWCATCRHEIINERERLRQRQRRQRLQAAACA